MILPLSLVQAQDRTYCEIKQELQDSKIFSAVKENRFFYLNEWFSGHNLDYSFTVDDKSKPSVLNTYEIRQSVGFEEGTELKFVDDYKKVIDSSALVHSDKFVYSVALLENEEG